MINEMKNLLEDLKTVLARQWKIQKLKDRSMEIIQSKDKNDKNEEKEVAYQRPMITIKHVNLLIMITERNERKRKLFEEIKAENIRFGEKHYYTSTRSSLNSQKEKLSGLYLDSSNSNC